MRADRWLAWVGFGGRGGWCVAWVRNGGELWPWALDLAWVRDGGEFHLSLV
jgi:hypothetical protein